MGVDEADYRVFKIPAFAKTEVAGTETEVKIATTEVANAEAEVGADKVGAEDAAEVSEDTAEVSEDTAEVRTVVAEDISSGEMAKHLLASESPTTTAIPRPVNVYAELLEIGEEIERCRLRNC